MTLQPVAFELQGAGRPVRVEGKVAPGYEALAHAFLRNFQYDEEEGAGCAAYVEGQPVAELWGGTRDAARGLSWERDTLVCTMSAGKAVTATAIAMLSEQGVLDLDAPVAKYWPAFGANGKSGVLLRWVLDHRAGVPALARTDPPSGALYDWGWMTETLAAQAPEWEPGKAAGYHILTQGYILGEVVRRATGRTLAEVVRDELARPLQADFHFGVAEADLARCAQLRGMTQPRGTLFDRAAIARDSLLGRGMVNLLDGEDFNSVAWRRAEISSANGHCTAMGLARIYALLANGGELGGQRLLRESTIRRMAEVQHRLTERVMNRAYHQGLGVLRSTYPVTWFGPGVESFGHHGVGGSLGFADPQRRLGFAYATAKFHSRLDTGLRARRVIEALYDSLEGGAPWPGPLPRAASMRATPSGHGRAGARGLMHTNLRQETS